MNGFGAKAKESVVRDTLIFQGDTAVVEVNGEKPSKTPGRFGLKNLWDGDPATCWIPRSIEKAGTIRISFKRPVYLRGIAVMVGWRKSILTTMEHDPGFVHVTVDGKDSVSTPPSGNDSQRSSYDCAIRPFYFDGDVIERLKETTVIPILKKVREVRLSTYPEAWSELRLLSDDSASLRLFPKELEVMRRKYDRKTIDSLGVDVRNLSKVSRDPANEFCLDPDRGRVHMASKKIKDPDSLSTYLRLTKKSMQGYLYFWATPIDGGWEYRFPEFPWEVTFLGLDPVFDKPVPANRGDGLDQTNFMSYPLVRLQAGKWRLDVKDDHWLVPGPEANHLNSKLQTELIDTTPPGVDTQSVVIGKQVWMKHNLTHSADDKNSLCWGMTKKDLGKWNRNCFEYGRLYQTKHAANLCPVGWRVPKLADWEELMRSTRSLDPEEVPESGSAWRLVAPGRWSGKDSALDPLGFSAKMFGIPPPLRRGIRYFELGDLMPMHLEFMTSDAKMLDYPEEEDAGPLRSDDRDYHLQKFINFSKEGALLCCMEPSKVQRSEEFRTAPPQNLFLPVRCIKNQSP